MEEIITSTIRGCDRLDLEVLCFEMEENREISPVEFSDGFMDFFEKLFENKQVIQQIFLLQ